MAGEEVAAGWALVGRQLPILTSLNLLPEQPGGLARLLGRDTPSPYPQSISPPAVTPPDSSPLAGPFLG